VLKISSFVLMLLRCQLRAEDFQLPSADVDDAPASCCAEDAVMLLLLMMLQPSCCDAVVVDDAPTFVL
jgi:hypothetical protein